MSDAVVASAAGAVLLMCLNAAGEMSSVLELSRRETARVVDGVSDPLRESHRRSAVTRRTACWTEDWSST